MFSSFKLLIAIGILVAVLGTLGAVYFQGRSDGSAACEARWLTREATRIEAQNKAIAERDARIAAALAENARRAAERLAHIDNLERQLEDYEKYQKDRPDDDCSITDDDAGSLSNIR